MGEKKMKNLNKCLLIAFILGALYAVYCITYFGGAIMSTEGIDQVGAGLATALVTPHMICVVIAVIFNGLGMYLKKTGFALVAAILYAVAMVLFIPYFFFVIIQMILAFVGYSQLKKANA